MQGPSKKQKQPKSVPHKDNYARVAFLYQASSIMAMRPQYAVLGRGLARNFDLVSKKSVMKVTPAMKRSICKKCNTFKIEGLSGETYIENLSKDNREKADVLIQKCKTCGHKRRFPVGKDMSYQLHIEKEGNTYKAE